MGEQRHGEEVKDYTDKNQLTKNGLKATLTSASH